MSTERMRFDPITGMPYDYENGSKSKEPSIHPRDFKYKSICAVPFNGNEIKYLVEPLNCFKETIMVRQWGCWINDYRIPPERITDISWNGPLLTIRWKVE